MTIVIFEAILPLIVTLLTFRFVTLIVHYSIRSKSDTLCQEIYLAYVILSSNVENKLKVEYIRLFSNTLSLYSVVILVN